MHQNMHFEKMQNENNFALPLPRPFSPLHDETSVKLQMALGSCWTRATRVAKQLRCPLA